MKIAECPKWYIGTCTGRKERDEQVLSMVKSSISHDLYYSSAETVTAKLTSVRKELNLPLYQVLNAWYKLVREAYALPTESQVPREFYDS